MRGDHSARVLLQILEYISVLGGHVATIDSLTHVNLVKWVHVALDKTSISWLGALLFGYWSSTVDNLRIVHAVTTLSIDLLHIVSCFPNISIADVTVNCYGLVECLSIHYIATLCSVHRVSFVVMNGRDKSMLSSSWDSGIWWWISIVLTLLMHELALSYIIRALDITALNPSDII